MFKTEGLYARVSTAASTPATAQKRISTPLWATNVALNLSHSSGTGYMSDTGTEIAALNTGESRGMNTAFHPRIHV